MIATIVCSIIFIAGVLVFILALLECENDWAGVGGFDANQDYPFPVVPRLCSIVDEVRKTK